MWHFDKLFYDGGGRLWSTIIGLTLTGNGVILVSLLLTLNINFEQVNAGWEFINTSASLVALEKLCLYRYETQTHLMLDYFIVLPDFVLSFRKLAKMIIWSH